MNNQQVQTQGAAMAMAAPQMEQTTQAAPDFAFNDEPVFSIDENILLSGVQNSTTVVGSADDFFSSPEWTDPSPALTTSMSFNLESCDTSPLLTDINEAPELAGMPLFGEQAQFPLFPTSVKDNNNNSFTSAVDEAMRQNASNKRSPQMAFSRVKDANEHSALLLLRAFNSNAVASVEKASTNTKDITYASPAAILSPLPSTSLAPKTPSMESLSSRGTKRRLESIDLLPIDAPIQPRNYKTPSATSRKDKLESSKASSFTEPSTPDLSNSNGDPLAAKRLSNTLAARRSRHRKAEELKQLHDTIEDLQSQVEMWKRRCMRAEEERDQAFA